MQQLTLSNPYFEFFQVQTAEELELAIKEAFNSLQAFDCYSSLQVA